MTYDQARLIDRILLLLLNNRRRLFSDQVSGTIGIDRGEVEHLFILMMNIEYQGGKIISYDLGGSVTGPHIEINFNTKRFIEAGGCEWWFKEQYEREQTEKELADLEKQKLINDIQAFRITKKQYRFTKWTAIIGFILAFTSILLQVFGVI